MAQTETKKHIKEEEGDEYENAVSMTGFGRYNALLLMVCGLNMLAVLTESLGMAYIMPAAQCDLSLTLTDKSVLSSISFLGIVSSSLLWGFIADVTGRRSILIITTLISSLFGVISAFMPYVWLFIVFRYFNGFFIGCATSVIIAYLGEFHGNKHRAKVLSWLGAFVAIAMVYLPGCAWIVLPMQWSFYLPGSEILFRPWRLLVILISLPTFAAAICLIKFPESPKFLWSVGKTDEALRILKDIYAANTGNMKDDFPIKKFTAVSKEQNLSEDDAPPKSFKRILNHMANLLRDQTTPLFRMPMLPNTIITSFLNFGIQAGANGVFLWFPLVINKMSLFMHDNPKEPVTICTAVHYTPTVNFTAIAENQTTDFCKDSVDEDVFLITLILAAVFSFLLIALGFVINFVGKKMLLVLMLILTTSAAIAVNNLRSYESIIIVMGLYLMAGPFVTTVNTVVVDLYPTQYRAMVVAITQMCGRFGAVAGSYVAGFLFQFYCSITFYVFAVQYLVLFVATMFLPLPLCPSRKISPSKVPDC